GAGGCGRLPGGTPEPDITCSRPAAPEPRGAGHRTRSAASTTATARSATRSRPAQALASSRPAPQREAARPRAAVPRVDEAACLGGSDRAMLGAVPAQRRAAEHPGEKRGDHDGERLRPEGGWYERDRDRREQRSGEHETLAATGDAETCEQRRERDVEPGQAAHEGPPHDELGRTRHLPGRRRVSVEAAEAPDPLAHD